VLISVINYFPFLFHLISEFAVNSTRPDDEPAIGVVSTLLDSLKEHQKTGVQFLWDNVVTSLKLAKQKNTVGA
jgi:hypothetical protein